MFMSILEFVSYVLGVVVWSLLISPRLKNIKIFQRVILAIIYFFLILYTPFFIHFIKNGSHFSDKKVIADIFLLTSFLVYIILFLETKLILPKIFLWPICTLITAIYHYMRGMNEQGNGDILFFVIGFIINLKYLKPVVKKFFEKDD